MNGSPANAADRLLRRLSGAGHPQRRRAGRARAAGGGRRPLGTGPSGRAPAVGVADAGQPRRRNLCSGAVRGAGGGHVRPAPGRRVPPGGPRGRRPPRLDPRAAARTRRPAFAAQSSGTAGAAAGWRGRGRPPGPRIHGRDRTAGRAHLDGHLEPPARPAIDRRSSCHEGRRAPAQTLRLRRAELPAPVRSRHCADDDRDRSLHMAASVLALSPRRPPVVVISAVLEHDRRRAVLVVREAIARSTTFGLGRARATKWKWREYLRTSGALAPLHCSRARPVRSCSGHHDVGCGPRAQQHHFHGRGRRCARRRRCAIHDDRDRFRSGDEACHRGRSITTHPSSLLIVNAAGRL